MQDLSVSLFFYMLHTDLDNGFYMLISDRIYDRLSVSSALYKLALSGRDVLWNEARRTFERPDSKKPAFDT